MRREGGELILHLGMDDAVTSQRRSPSLTDYEALIDGPLPTGTTAELIVRVSINTGNLCHY